jgi:hypothetical protein
MAQIPSHAQWMKDTHSLTSPRSALLKEVDDVIDRYGKTPRAQNKEAIKSALDKGGSTRAGRARTGASASFDQKGEDHSTIINFAVGEYGTENWMFDVESSSRRYSACWRSAGS